MKKQQQGFVSILVTMIIIVFVTLVAVGFAFLARQNTNQAIDSHLSSQAFYAAESGVNEAIKTNLGDTNLCSNPITSPVSNATLDPGPPVKITCVLVNKEPGELLYTNLASNKSKVVHIHTADNSPIGALAISWQSSDGSSGFANNNSNFYLPQKPFIDGSASSTPNYDAKTAQFPNSTPILRTTVVRTADVTNDDNILNAQQDLFLYPRAFSNQLNAGANNLSSINFRTPGFFNQVSEGDFADGMCNPFSKPLYCNAQVVFGGLATNDIYLRLEPIYAAANIQIHVYNSPASSSNDSNSVAISGAQEVIDSTGVASDTVRRIQVRVPLDDNFIYPEFAVESANTICKSFQVAPAPTGATVITPAPPSGDNPYLTGINNQTADNAACQLPT